MTRTRDTDEEASSGPGRGRPYNRDGGQRQGRRHIHGERGPLRAALYRETLSSLRCHDTMRGYYDPLIARGKPGLVALVACMRKLIVIVNAMVKAGTTSQRASPAEA